MVWCDMCVCVCVCVCRKFFTFFFYFFLSKLAIIKAQCGGRGGGGGGGRRSGIEVCFFLLFSYRFEEGIYKWSVTDCSLIYVTNYKSWMVNLWIFVQVTCTLHVLQVTYCSNESNYKYSSYSTVQIYGSN